jgi:hypothetical protein
MSPTMNAASPGRIDFPRLMMSASAVFLCALGLPCVFAPDRVLTRLAGSTSGVAELIVQLTGALYLGFAALNWMSRGSLMGGIYGRPVALGNFLHFLAGGVAVMKAAPAMGQPALAWPVAIGYAFFALGFARVMFRNPLAPQEGP